MSNTDSQTDMHAESVLGHLEELAQKLEVDVREGKYEGKGGMARWRDRWVLLVDKSMPTEARVSLFLDELSKLEMDNVFMKPAVRELFEKRRRKPGLGLRG